MWTIIRIITMTTITTIYICHGLVISDAQRKFEKQINQVEK